MTDRFDAAVIGTGQAGPPLANRLTQAGMTVAVIERGRFGGTCVNTGCTPTKTMVACAYAAHLAARAADYGVAIEGHMTVDMKKSGGPKGHSIGHGRKEHRKLAFVDAGLHCDARPCALRFAKRN